MAKIPGLPVAFVAIGGVLVWSGIENEPVTAIFRSLASGKAPAKGPGETFATPGVATGAAGNDSATGAGATGSAIADDALRYTGHPYVWGGPANVNGGWDCSSFVSWVLGHDLGMAIPGGSWAQATGSGTSHGPDVARYVLWGGATGVPRAQVQAGDLILWPPNEHVGIATSNTMFVSALNQSLGTLDITMASNGAGWIARRLLAANTSPDLGAVPPGKVATL